MELNHEILSEIVVWSKYAKYDQNKQRRETWDEIVDRNMQMHIRKFPRLEKEIKKAYTFVYDKKILPSMRSLQFAGKPIEVNHARLFNCSYVHIDDYRAFNETMFLLLSGTGVGYSVQRHHVAKLPAISKTIKKKRYLVADNVEGWSDSIKVLMKSYLGLSTWKPDFDFRSIRAKGERLITSGGVAPGPEPLKICLAHIEAVLDRKQDGEKLTSLECHDILCHIANAVLSGGIRRSAMISLFDYDDEEMLTCKFGNWWELNPQRGRSNNSAVIKRNGVVSKEDFMELWKKVELSNSGEPGFYFTNDVDLGTNPCCFTGDTRLLTANGYKTFEELAQREIYSLVNSDGEIVDGSVWSTGFKQIVEVKLANGKKIRCTPDHRFMDNEFNSVEAKDLKGKRIMPFFSINNEINEFAKYGFIQGDGATGRLSSENHKGLEIYFGEKDLDIANIFGFEEVGKTYVNGYNEILKAYGFSSEQLPYRTMPQSYHAFDYKDKLMFLKGMYSANGSVVTTSRIAYKTTSKKLADQLAVILSSLGLSPYITTNKVKTVEFSNGNYECKESYDINIGQLKDIIWFAENIAFIQGYKNHSLSQLIIDRGPFVASVNSCGSAEVFDFNLTSDNHWGVVEGVVAHNCEISLKSFQFCNLVEINASDLKDQHDFEERTAAAAFIGTLQASYTDFHYLRPEWKEVTEREALLGIGMTGIASGAVLNLDMPEAAEVAYRVNRSTADEIGIKSAHRITCVKPSGTSSLVLGTSSGVHAWHDQYYIRRMRLGKNEALYTYLAMYHPELIEDDVLSPSNQAVVSVPVAAPEGAITRASESAIQFLERVKLIHEKWIKPGHVVGENTHNVSATVTLKNNEWKMVGEWLWENQNHYNGLSFLPEDLGSYQQTPFETITKEEYEKMSSGLSGLSVANIVEINDNTNLMGEQACSGGACEIS
jgi:hypothetical protein